MRNETLYLQQMIKSHKHPASVLAITSGKGGVGKSNIAAKMGNSESAQLDGECFFKKVVNWFF